MRTLRLMYGDKIPKPTKTLISRWGTDPFSLGAYSYSVVGSKQPDDRLAIGATVANKLFFAGEATSQNYPSTVTGAHLSGLEVANKVSQVVEFGRERFKL